MKEVDVVETVSPFKEVIEEIVGYGGEAVKYCYQCGKCDTVCPWNKVRTFSMRKLIREATFGLTEIENEEIWRCTTCGNCAQKCPREVKQIEDMKALRRMASSYGVFPTAVKPVRGIAANLTAEGNPFGESRKERAAWAKDLDVKTFEDDMEYLYFPGCYLCYDPRLKKVAQATARVLNAAGVNYGILGELENCCGESIRKTGNEELFKKLAKDNIKTFVERGVKKIIVSSPHCYHTFVNEYPEFMVHFEIVHVSQLLNQLLNEGKLTINKEYAQKVTYHDPCYLGRHNNVFDSPREVLAKVPGLEVQEMMECREESLCCGMGGGRIWMETHAAERFSNIRIKDAMELGAKELVTACPYCITMFEDSRAVQNLDDIIQIKDITEILQEVI